MFFCYIVKCHDGTLYTGITTNIKRRIVEHNTSPRGAKYTRVRRPVMLVYQRRFRNRSNASKAEVRLKALSRAEKQQLIIGT